MVQPEISKPLRRQRETSSQPNSQREGSQGFALVGLITLMPVLMALLLGVIAFTQKIVSHQKTQSTCEKNLFKMQDRLAGHMNRLTALNPKALALRVRFINDSTRLAAATLSLNAPLIALYTTRVGKVVSERSKLDRRQKQILRKARLEVERQKVYLRMQLLTYGPQVTAPPPQMEPDFRYDIAPLYFAKPNLEHVQTARASYRQGDQRYKCAVTVESRTGVFRARLTEVL
jgi:hypothetical protein